MRGKLRVTRTAWFGPKRYLGWGWSPRTWQGWTIMIIFVATIILVSAAIRDLTTKIVADGILLAAVVLGAFLTGDGPGGPE
ncbi:hypothetical protein Rai3103_16810 [Raineyella fluvialis]|uniref:Uncharacterized protein n=1 Tax=Raineyella fluvialis TaxID=2662261 RepID=A0A5Q2FK10_9ACTN|nr:hypothetical protein Rai3103_16810 [Raineyella fluvialis]